MYENLVNASRERAQKAEAQLSDERALSACRLELATRAEARVKELEAKVKELLLEIDTTHACTRNVEARVKELEAQLKTWSEIAFTQRDRAAKAEARVKELEAALETTRAALKDAAIEQSKNYEQTQKYAETDRAQRQKIAELETSLTRLTEVTPLCKFWQGMHRAQSEALEQAKSEIKELRDLLDDATVALTKKSELIWILKARNHKLLTPKPPRTSFVDHSLAWKVY